MAYRGFEYYPKHVYSNRVDITRANMARYDKLNSEFWDEVYATPGYRAMTFREQYEVRREIKDKDKYSYLR